MSNAARQLIGPDFLRVFEPLGRIGEPALRLLADHVAVHEYKPFQRLPRHLTERNLLFLLSGRIEVVPANGRSRVLAEATPQARRPIMEGADAGTFVKARTHCSVLAVDKALLDSLTSNSSPVLPPSPDEAAWLKRFLAAPALSGLPRSSVQALLVSGQELSVRAGAIIAQEDDAHSLQSTWFYILKEGRCQLTSRGTRYGVQIELPPLHAGDSFGEDALGQRALTATMLSHGSLIRIHSRDLTEYLIKPLVTYVTPEQAREYQQHGAIILDVRPKDEASKASRSGREGLPLPLLRARLRELRSDGLYLIIGSEVDAAAAALVLLQSGFDASVVLERAPSLLERRRSDDERYRTPKTAIAAQRRDPPPPRPTPHRATAAQPKTNAGTHRHLSAKLHEAQLKAERQSRRAAQAEIARLKAEQNAAFAARGKEKAAAKRVALDAAKRAKHADEARRQAEREAEDLRLEVERARHRSEKLAAELAGAVEARRQIENELSRTNALMQALGTQPDQDRAVDTDASGVPILDIGTLPDEVLWETALGLRQDKTVERLFGGAEPPISDAQSQNFATGLNEETGQFRNVATYAIDSRTRRPGYTRIVAGAEADHAHQWTRHVTGRRARQRLRVALLTALLVVAGTAYVTRFGAEPIRQYVVTHPWVKAGVSIGRDLPAVWRQL